MRAQILAARAKQLASSTTNNTRGNSNSSEQQQPPQARMQPASSSAVSPSATAGAITLPRWTGDMTKKNRKREQEKEDRALESARKKAKKAGVPFNQHKDEEEDKQQEDENDLMCDTSAAMEVDAGAGVSNGIDRAASSSSTNIATPADTPLCLSAAKKAFLSSRQQQQQPVTATAPSSSTKSVMAPVAIAGTKQAAPPIRSTAAPPLNNSAAPAASSSSSTPALPAFSPSKRPTLLVRGTGVVPGTAPAKQKSAIATEGEPTTRYYRCSFAPRSSKKHKNYEDGVLSVCGRKCTLQNMASEVKSSSLASQSTSKFEVGGVYTIASHEIELGELISSDDYMSGRVFVGDSNLTFDPKAAKGSTSDSSPQKKSKVGAALFTKQPLANKPRPKQPDPLELMKDPSVLMLNSKGIIERNEKAVVVDLHVSKQLRVHQREALQFMYDCVMGLRSPGNEGCILADEMGLGKTLSAIALLYTLLQSNPVTGGRRGVVQKVIIVCPATLVGNWSKEFTKWLTSVRCKPLVLLSSMHQSEQAQMVEDFIVGQVNNVLIVGYELLRKHVKELKRVPPCLLICDEGHRLKSTTSNQTIKSLISIPTKKRVMLTGTPVQNDLGELFAMADFVNPGVLGSLQTFSHTFMKAISRSRDTSSSRHEKLLGEARSQALHDATRGFILRRSNEILLQYLPEKIEQVLFIPLAPKQVDIYRALLQGKAIRQVLARQSQAGGHDAMALTAINSLKKLCNHAGLVYEEAREFASENVSLGGMQSASMPIQSAFSYYPDNYVPQSNFGDVTQSSKLSVLEHLLVQVRRENNKIVVVSNYIQTLDMLAVFLEQRGYHFLRLDGQTSAQDRMSLVDRFNASYQTDAFVFLLSAKAGGVGLNLIGGNRLVLFDPDWYVENPAIDAQAMSRIWRDGQKSRVYIYRFLATATIDEKIYQRQIRKRELSMSVMDASASDALVRNFDSKSLKEIFTYRQDTKCETRDMLLKTRKGKKNQPQDDEEDANEQKESNADELHTMGEFLTDLSRAMDPLLHTLPPHLLSCFLNRVSSEEENRRMLKLLSEREEAKAAQQARNSTAGKAEEEEAKPQDEEEEAEDLPSYQVSASASASASHDAADDADEDAEDDGEEEYETPSFPGGATTALISPSFAIAKMNYEDEENDTGGEHLPTSVPYTTSPHRRKRIIDDEEEKNDESDFVFVDQNEKREGASIMTTQQQRNDNEPPQEEDEPEWMRIPASTQATTILESAALDVTTDHDM